MPGRYEIVLAGPPSALVEHALEGFEITSVGPDRFSLTGTVTDQAALHGALHQLQDLRLVLIDVHRVEPD